jgi:hypothetical protein
VTTDKGEVGCSSQPRPTNQLLVSYTGEGKREGSWRQTFVPAPTICETDCTKAHRLMRKRPAKSRAEKTELAPP